MTSRYTLAVLDYTKSGKAIFESHGHAMYDVSDAGAMERGWREHTADWTAADHIEAALAHMQRNNYAIINAHSAASLVHRFAMQVFPELF